MKLMTLNCHSWQEENQVEKIKYLAKTIKENNYDVVALQEVSQLIESAIVYKNIKEDNFALLLQKELENLECYDYKFFWDFAHIGYDIYEEGLCIFTRLPIKNTKSFFVSKSNDTRNYKTRKIVKLTVEYNNKEVDIYSCHLGWWNDEDESFTYQVDKLINNISKKTLSLVMGDFNNNANIRNEGSDYILYKGLFDTFTLAKEKDSGITIKGEIDGWDKNKDDMRLDIIYTNKYIEVLKSEVIFNNNNKDIISDHFGVEVIINNI